MSTGLTARVWALEPLKKVFNPIAASTPLVSLEKANDKFDEVVVSESLPDG